MSKKYILLSLEDERIKSISEIFGNKTASRIINFLTEKDEASQKDISDELGMPMNTVEYNIKKMVKAEIVEESKNFFWSPKGKKIKMYRVSNKSIVISPRSKNIASGLKQILPVALISGLAAVGIRYYYAAQQTVQKTAEDAGAMLASAPEAAIRTAESGTVNVINTTGYSLWFLAGALFAIILIVLKTMMYEKSWEPRGEK